MATVAELIEQLSKLDQSARISVDQTPDFLLGEFRGNYYLDDNFKHIEALDDCKLIHQFNQ